MTNGSIAAVLFDWGGVIQRTLDPEPRRTLAAELGLSPEALDRRVFGHPLWPLASVGALSAETLWNAICRDLGWPCARATELVRRFFAGDCVDERIIALIAALRAGGTLVALLSNAPPPLDAAGRAGHWGQEGLFDLQLFSYQTGVLKPDARAYRCALAAMGRSPAEVAFIDDAAANATAARRLGFQAIRYSGTEALIDSLAALDLPHRS